MEHVVCNLCGADDPRHLYRNFDRDISRCGACGLVYAGPERLTREETWGRYNPTYFRDEYLPSLGVVDGRFDLAFFDARHARTLRTLAAHRENGRLLEVGCGAGFFLKAAERTGWTVKGLEVMAAGAAFARDTLGLDVVDAAVEDIDLPVGHFDVVVMFEVIEHISDPKALLRRAWALLRPGGCLALTTPNIGALSRHVLGGDWAVLNPGEHLFYFDERTLGRTLADAGFGDVVFDRLYAGANRFDAAAPMHTFAPRALRALLYMALVRALSPGMLTRLQARGLADGLHVTARKPG